MNPFTPEGEGALLSAVEASRTVARRPPASGGVLTIWCPCAPSGSSKRRRIYFEKNLLNAYSLNNITEKK